jgi:UPF0716 protein FxsA
MPVLILLAILAVPLIEIAVFIQVGQAIGVFATLVIIVLGTIVGVSIVKLQGLAVLTRAREQMDAGVVPDRELFDAVCLLLAGFLILLPGFVTDSLGVLLLLPPVRDLLRRAASGYVQRHGHVETRFEGDGRPRSSRTGVIEGEYEEVDEAPPSDERGGGQGPDRLP